MCDITKQLVKEWEEAVSGPGKFEGQPRYMPFYYSLYLEGSVDQELPDGALVFNVTPEDVYWFPELRDQKRVCLYCDEQGFVSEVDYPEATGYAYIFQADLYCESCGEGIRSGEFDPDEIPEDPEDETSYDSDDYPKGPFPVSEADSPQHCAACGCFLENPLTREGLQYVREAIKEGTGDREVLLTWLDFYRDELEA